MTKTRPNTLTEVVDHITKELSWVSEEDAEDFALWSSSSTTPETTTNGDTRTTLRLTLAHIRALERWMNG